MFKWIYRISITFALVALLITNVLSITSTGFNFALTGLVATVMGVKTATGMLHRQIATQKVTNARLRSRVAVHKTQVRNVGKRLISRTKRLATMSIAEIPASIIPFAGLSILAAGTVWELKQLCDGLHEVEELYAQMEIDEPLDGEALRIVCNPSSWKFPTKPNH